MKGEMSSLRVGELRCSREILISFQNSQILSHDQAAD